MTTPIFQNIEQLDSQLSFVTLNLTTRRMEAYARATVVDIVTDDLLITPGESDMFLIASTGAVNAFSGKENQLAVWVQGTWYFTIPTASLVGYTVFDIAGSVTRQWNGVAWI